jgi:hypothetical protein
MDALLIIVYFVNLRVFEPSPKGIPMGVVMKQPVLATNPPVGGTKQHEEFLLNLFRKN